MPTSVHNQLNEIVELIVMTDPHALLDVGVGFGKYGLLAREYLEYWDGRDEYRDWQRRIDGIEIFPEYLTPVHKFVYDTVYTGNALDIIPTLNTHYDLILLIDVLEHFNHAEGSRLLTDCLRISRNVLISTPRDYVEQEASFHNPHEIHRFHWRAEHLKPFGNVFVVPHHTSLIAYLGRDAETIGQKIKRRRFGERYPIIRAVYRATKKITGRDAD